MRIQAPADWAILVYSSASPDLERDAVAALDELARARQPDSVVLGAQLGRPGGASRYRFTGETDQELAAPPVETLPDVDMSRPQALEDFLRWGMRAFPARNYMVVLGGHGGGFLGSVGDVNRTRMMRPPEMAGALAASGLHPQVLVLNSCLMAQAEVAVEAAPRADYLVASQGEEHLAGLPLARALERLDGTTSPEAAARMLVEESGRTPERTPAMSALSLAEVPALARALDGLGRAILAAPSLYPEMRRVLRELPHFRPDRPNDRPLTDYRDLSAFARRLPELGDPALARAARDLEGSLGEVVLAAVARPDHEGANGLSAWLPTENLRRTHGPAVGWVEDLYRSLALSRTTAWDEAMAALAG